MRGIGSMGVPLQCVAAVSDWDAYELRVCPKLAIDHAFEAATALLNQDHNKLMRQFKCDGVLYEFIDHWEDLTMEEYIDMETFGSDLTKHAHKFLNVCYRPAGRKRKYTPGTAETFRRVPATVLGGAVVFFCAIQNSLELTSRHSISQAVLQPHQSAPTMAGITRFLSWPTKTLAKLMKSKNGLYVGD